MKNNDTFLNCQKLFCSYWKQIAHAKFLYHSISLDVVTMEFVLLRKTTEKSTYELVSLI